MLSTLCATCFIVAHAHILLPPLVTVLLHQGYLLQYQFLREAPLIPRFMYMFLHALLHQPLHQLEQCLLRLG